jgi:hypothetical protein
VVQENTNVITIDFRNAPPSMGSQYTHVPPGTYGLKILSAKKTRTKANDRDMVEIEFGISRSSNAGDVGKKLMVERFALPRPGTSDSLFPIQRFNKLIEAISGNALTAEVSLNLDTFAGHEVLALLDEEDSTYEGKTRKQNVIMEFASIKQPMPAAATAPPSAPAPPVPTQAPAPANGAAAPVNMGTMTAPVAVDNGPAGTSIDSIFGSTV